MNKKILAVFLCAVLVFTCGCAKNTKSNSDAGTSQKTTKETKPVYDTSDNEDTMKKHDVYPYSIKKDRANFNENKINIVVGDKLYMTQINDWFKNFDDYSEKTVEIEGYYIKYKQYNFVGRKGPTCPYCTGGYVDFEYQTDKNPRGLSSEHSWIKVIGILRQGIAYPGGGDPGQPFCYIEAVKVIKMPQVGKGTIKN